MGFILSFKFKFSLATVLLAIILPAKVLAGPNIETVQYQFKTGDQNLIYNKSNRLYVSLKNSGDDDYAGSVSASYSLGGKTYDLGSHPIYVILGQFNISSTFFDFAPKDVGQAEFSIKAGNQELNFSKTISGDNDLDGTIDPEDPDDDNDGMPDEWELKFNLDPFNNADANEDADGDGLTNLEEYKLGTDPTKKDTDGDGMPDEWENYYGLKPSDSSDANQDKDGDGLTNLEEYKLGTDPTKKDTDGDGYDDKIDLYPLDITRWGNQTSTSTTDTGSGSDPDSTSNTGSNSNSGSNSTTDTDGDGMPDQWEKDHSLNPNDASDANSDPDGDGLTNLEEYKLGTDPTNKDTDGDGINDKDDPNPLNPNYKVDQDLDQIPDEWESINGLNPNDASDANSDPDGDSLTNQEEYQQGTDPQKSDTDGDGANDAKDKFPLDHRYIQDTDGDGMPDQWEKDHSLNPNDASDANSDPDGDGLTNLQEFIAGTDPNQRSSNKFEVSDGALSSNYAACLGSAKKPLDVDGDWITNRTEEKYKLQICNKTTYWWIPDLISYFVIRFWWLALITLGLIIAWLKRKKIKQLFED
jgi:hypothetical protein